MIHPSEREMYRERFACAAMQGIIVCNFDKPVASIEAYASLVAARAVEIADALIEELNKPIKP